jgi:hypothetical protein
MLRKDVRKELLNVARARRTVTYGHLMKKFRISRGHPKGFGIGGVIEEIDRFEYKQGAPGFAALVVRRDTGYPGGGYFSDDELPTALRRTKKQSLYPKLSEKEKEHIRKQQEKIWSFYTDVLPKKTNPFRAV